MSRALLVAVLLLLSACSIPVRRARLDPLAAPLPEEELAAERVRAHRCGPALSLLWPGLGHLCHDRDAEGAALAAVAAVELGAGVALLGKASSDASLFEGSGASVPLLMWQDTHVYAFSDALLDRHRARRLRYTPLDTTPELLAAPFNVQVLKEPWVWGGIVGLGAGAAAITLALEPAPSPRPEHVDVFGAELAPSLGYPLAGLSGVVLFEHVALAEEVAFRGLLQSSLVRATGSEWAGWALGSLIFGGFHAFNAVMLPPEDQLEYLTVSVPWITLTGSWLGLAYLWGEYSLTYPVAIHFWYDLAVTGLQVGRSPDRHIFSMSLSWSL